MAHVGGRVVTDGLARFFALQDAISTELEARGELSTWKGSMPLDVADDR